ncbi:MAG: CHASE2 domain-containing protein [Saprospiraceae bacterium]|nr:CHASE2 domain-containing protein [Saprospiraceae bacterium]
MPTAKYKGRLFATLNAGCMLLLALFWLSLPRTFGDEAFFIKWTSIIKKSLLGIDKKPLPNSVLYIDVSGSKATVEIPDPLYEEPTGYHHAVITDRVQLADFLQAIAKYGKNIPLVIMDISFESTSPQDSILQAAIDSFPFPLLGARRLDEQHQLVPSVLQMQTGVANYLSPDNSFMKYPLFLADTLPSLPLMAWATTEGKKYNHKGLYPRLDGHRSLHKPIIDFKIRPYDLNTGTRGDTLGYTLRTMGTLLYEWTFWEEADIKRMLKDKIIIIGDYYQDKHETVFGNLPGPLIVHNAYLTLVQGESLIPWKWVLLLYTLFWWMSARAFNEVANRKSDQKNNIKSAVGRIVVDSIDETFFLALGTILSYFLFNIHINILILLIYLKFVSYILGRFVFTKPIAASSS